ncbi:MAG: hypothetical protein WB441_05255 [Nocardioidaceae bacterium]
MHWDRRLGDLTAALLADREPGPDGPALTERDAEVAEQQVAEYAMVDLAGRLQASVGLSVGVRLVGGWRVLGVVVRAGEGWCLLTAAGGETVVRLAAVVEWQGLADAAVPGRARPVAARLGIGSVLRATVDPADQPRLHRVDGSTVTGVLGRVGADFVEVRVVGAAPGRLHVVPFTALAAVQRG